MKAKSTYTSLRILFLVLVIFITGSCLDYTVNTIVSKDGSVIREYVVRGDSADIFKGSLRIPFGEWWKISHIYVNKEKEDSTSEKSQYAYKASRKFESIEEFSRWMADDTSANTVKPRVSVLKKFRWFYTYFYYSEVYPMSFPFQKVPADSFLTKEELLIITKEEHMVYAPLERKMVWKSDTTDYLYTAADSVEMKKITDKADERFQEWMIAGIVAEYVDVMHDRYGNDTTVSRLLVNSLRLKEIVYDKAQFFSLFSNDSLNALVLTVIADSMLHSNRLSEIYLKDASLFKEFNLKMMQIDDILLDDQYSHSLTMPGRVFATNADKLTLDALNWDFEPVRFFLMDFEMKASSRVANPWIMVLTALASVMLAGVLFLKRKR